MKHLYCANQSINQLIKHCACLCHLTDGPIPSFKVIGFQVLVPVDGNKGRSW